MTPRAAQDPLPSHRSLLISHFSSFRSLRSLFALHLSWGIAFLRRSQICDFSWFPCALSRDVALICHVHSATGVVRNHDPAPGRPVTDTFGQPFQPLWLRSLTATDTPSLPLTDLTPHGPSGLSRGVVISGEVRCHIGASTTSRSPAPPAGFPGTLAVCCTSSTSARSSEPPFEIVDVDASIAEMHWDWRMPPWIM